MENRRVNLTEDQLNLLIISTRNEMENSQDELDNLLRLTDSDIGGNHLRHLHDTQELEEKISILTEVITVLNNAEYR